MDATGEGVQDVRRELEKAMPRSVGTERERSSGEQVVAKGAGHRRPWPKGRCERGRARKGMGRARRVSRESQPLH